MRRVIPAALGLFIASSAVAADANPAALAKTLSGGSVTQRIDAAKAIAGAAEVSPIVPQLVTALADDYFDVRENCAETLRKAGPAAVPALVAAMKKEDYYSRYYSVRTLRRIGPAARDAMGPLIEALGDSAIEVRQEAAAAIYTPCATAWPLT